MALLPTTSMVIRALFLFVAVLVTQAASGGGKATGKAKTDDLVVEACRNMSSDLLVGTMHFDEEPCVSVLRSDNRSMLAKDNGDLTVIALDLVDDRCNKAMVRMDSMLRGIKDFHNLTERAFQFCSADYAAIVRSLPVCHTIFDGLKPLGKSAPCFLPDQTDDAIMALHCLDIIGMQARECEGLLDSYWDDSDADEFRNTIRYMRLAWGLMEMATDCRDDKQYSAW